MALAYVNRGRWVVRCPFGCGSADVAWTTWFLCRNCLNNATGDKVPLAWPSPEDMAAIEAALAPRPVEAQNWELNESIGYLLVENVVDGGLFDPTSGRIAGDVGADQNRLPGLLALAGARAELGA